MKSKRVSLTLGVAFSLLIAILIGVGLLGLGQMSRMNDKTQDVTDVRWVKVKLSREALHYSDLNNRITMEVFLLEDKQKIAALLDERARNTEIISSILQQIEAQVSSNDEKAALAKVAATRKPYVDSYLKALDLLIKQEKPEEARKVMVEVTLPNLLIYHGAWEDFVAFQGRQMDRAGDSVESYYWSARSQVGSLVALALALAAFIAVFVTRRMTSEISNRQRAEEELREAHEGLEVRVRERTAELEALHHQLLDISRKAGMAEVATGVLHNVGNVLNSINISSTLVVEQMQKSGIAHLTKAIALMRDHQADLGTFVTTDPQGKHLLDFFTQLAEHLNSEQVAMVNELAQLQKNVEHIKVIVSSQQAYASSAGFSEMIDLHELVEDALRIHHSAIMRHDINLVKELAEVPRVLADKHKVLQILVNLLSNAKHAMKDSPVKNLTLKIESADDSVRVSVGDSGCGIPAENLSCIFAHGFTTKKDGHGFGLHSGALAAKQMGGELRVTSAGPGQGTVFTLELPLETREAATAA
jgi:signal transduction histidine kinase